MAVRQIVVHSDKKARAWSKFWRKSRVAHWGKDFYIEVLDWGCGPFYATPIINFPRPNRKEREIIFLFVRRHHRVTAGVTIDHFDQFAHDIYPPM